MFFTGIPPEIGNLRQLKNLDLGILGMGGASLLKSAICDN